MQVHLPKHISKFLSKIVKGPVLWELGGFIVGELVRDDAAGDEAPGSWMDVASLVLVACSIPRDRDLAKLDQPLDEFQVKVTVEEDEPEQIRDVMFDQDVADRGSILLQKARRL